ncbi:hypothetical protein CW711_06105 [Candidatus Bathyarchaeota archaeon]|nr:MAG: hypothetical protein CW711_06105 [Candidatus Bathyarchaeota archaeon]
MSDETAEEREEYYPLKTLHNFLQEIDREWDSFKTAAIIGIILLVTLMAFTSYRLLMFIHMLRAGMKILRILDEILFTALVIYEIYLLSKQYNFFKKWERRMGLLLHVEKRLLEKRE